MQLLNRCVHRIWASLKYMLSNPHFFICFMAAWMVTNGWAYVGVFVGRWIGCEWILTICSGYIAVLWLPFTPEKLITIPIAAFLLKIFFPADIDALKMVNEIKN